MKKLIAAIIVSLPLTTFASVITFVCKSSEIEGIHKFDAKGIVSVDDNNEVEGVISLQTQKAQAEGSIQVFEEVKIKGTFQHFEATAQNTGAFDKLTLNTNETYVRSLNLLLDFKVDIASQALSVDNFLYRSNCQTLSSSK